MLDLAWIMGTLLFFIACGGFLRLCQSLRGDA